MTGFRMVQLTNLVRDELASTGVPPSYDEAAMRLGLDGRGHVCNIARRAEKSGLLKREGSGRSRRLRLA